MRYFFISESFERTSIFLCFFVQPPTLMDAFYFTPKPGILQYHFLRVQNCRLQACLALILWDDILQQVIPCILTHRRGRLVLFGIRRDWVIGEVAD